MRDELLSAIRSSAVDRGKDAPPVISLEAVQTLASRKGLEPREVEIASLETGVVPLRYVRNIGTIGIPGQLELLRSCVGICGLGGLGGYVAELLARMGVGRLVLADYDFFEEDNLNRQLLSDEQALGRPKSERASERLAAVNSSVSVAAHHLAVDALNATEIFADADVVVDALDTVSSRLALEEGCAVLAVPMVHGAIAGTSGQVMTIFPGDPGLRALYTDGEDRGVEVFEGNPSTTPALVASLQSQEVVKIICGGDTLRDGFLLIDTYSNLYQFIPLT